jgi:hypothetical protein
MTAGIELQLWVEIVIRRLAGECPLLARLGAMGRAETGAHWSGPRFFGLPAAGAERPSNGGRDR